MPNVGQCRRLACGFTLLELMMVLLVVGISLGLVVPHFMKGDEDALKDEALRLAVLMEYAADSASSRGLWLAWTPTVSGYRFLQRDEDKDVWQPIATDEVLRERRLPEGMRLGITGSQQFMTASKPIITLSPTGIRTPFQITLYTEKSTRVVVGNLLGQIDILNPSLVAVQAL